MLLENKAAAVTGAAGGIGAKICETFIKEGAKVIGLDLPEQAEVPEGTDYYSLDVSKTEDCETLLNQLIDKYGKIDVLINCAGITRDALTKKMTEEQFDQVIDVNIKGTWHMTRILGPHMQKNGGGSIVNISSVVAAYGNVGQANYVASKAAVVGMAKTWAKEFSFGGGNVRVNALAPGYTYTNMLKTVPEHLLKQFESQTMLGRLGEPQEIANAALFLASDLASYVTGTLLQVDGGMRL